MPKPLELRKVIGRLSVRGIQYVTGSGKHPKFVNPQSGGSYPVKCHGLKTTINTYALNDLIKTFNLPKDIFD